MLVLKFECRLTVLFPEKLAYQATIPDSDGTLLVSNLKLSGEMERFESE